MADSNPYKTDPNAATAVPAEPVATPNLSRVPVPGDDPNPYKLPGYNDPAAVSARKLANQGWIDWSKDAARAFMDATTRAATFNALEQAGAVKDYATGKFPTLGEAEEARGRQILQQRVESPWASLGGDVLGSAAGYISGSRLLGALGAGGAAVARGAAEALPTWLGGTGGRAVGAAGVNALPRAIGYGTEGAIQGGLQGAGGTFSANPVDYATNAATGAGVGALVGGVTGAATPAKSFAPVPVDAQGNPIRGVTAQELEAARDADYTRFRNTNAPYDTSTFGKTALDAAEARMRATASFPQNAGSAYSILDSLRKHPNSEITPAEIDAARKQLIRIKNSATDTNNVIAARQLQDEIDKFILNPPPGAMNWTLPQQNYRDAANYVLSGRLNHAALKRSEEVTDRIAGSATAAERRDAPLEGPLRSKLSVFDDPTSKAGVKAATGMTDAEVNEIRDVVTGKVMNPVLKGARVVGNALSRTVPGLGGGGLGGLATYVASGSPELGVATAVGAPIVGYGMQAGADYALKRGAEAAAQTLRNRSPLFVNQIKGYTPGPGMGPVGQAATGAGSYVLGAPRPDPEDTRNIITRMVMPPRLP